jgi:hypothetical protein
MCATLKKYFSLKISYVASLFEKMKEKCNVSQKANRNNERKVVFLNPSFDFFPLLSNLLKPLGKVT